MIRSADVVGRPSLAASHDPGVLRLNIRLIISGLALAVAVVIAASFWGSLSLMQLGLTRQDVPEVHEQLSRVIKFLLKFDAGGEQTVAAWLSSSILLLCAMVLVYIAAMQRQRDSDYIWHWLALGIIFCGLSMDEAVGMHEMTIEPLRETLGTSGIFLYAWVVPAIGFVALLGLAYLGFLWHLEPTFRIRFLVAAVLFVGGAVGFEMMEGALVIFYGHHQLIYEGAVNLEDALEFAGELVFLHSLLLYSQRVDRQTVLRLT